MSVPYATLHRFAVAELGFGRAAPTVPIADGVPGEEVQLDTGWVGTLEPDALGKRHRFRSWIFTAVGSRHRFVWPCRPETTASAIEACEAAWAFFGGVFRVLLPDNTKAIVAVPDALDARNQYHLSGVCAGTRVRDRPGARTAPPRQSAGRAQCAQCSR